MKTKIDINLFIVCTYAEYLSDLKSVQERRWNNFPLSHLVDKPGHKKGTVAFRHKTERIGGVIQLRENDACFEGLFNCSGIKGAGSVLQMIRIGYACALGRVPRLYCWESLVPLYTKRGWATVKVHPFDPALAPDGWQGGEQACHEMIYPNASKACRESVAFRYGAGLALK